MLSACAIWNRQATRRAGPDCCKDIFAALSTLSDVPHLSPSADSRHTLDQTRVSMGFTAKQATQ